MKLARFAVERPVFLSMVACIVLILGGISLSRLPVDLMPDITYPTVSISTRYEDASPQEVEQLVTKLVEEAVSAVTGVEQITSTSTEGNSNVRVSFTWGTDLNAATADIRDRIDRILSRLPDDADRPTVRKFDVAAFPIIICGVATELDLLEAQEIIDDQVQYRIERLPGVANLEVFGGQAREIRVELDLDRVKAFGLSLERVIGVIRAGNVTTPAGNVEVGPLDIRVRVPGTYTTTTELAETVLDYRDGAPVRLRDVAEVVDDKEDVTRIVRVNGKPGLRMGVRKQSGANTVAVARGVLEEIKAINRDIPQLNLVPLLDTSDYIKRAIRNVSTSAAFGSVLAILVLLFFLRNLRSTLIIATSIPISVVATFVMIYFGGFTLNIMTLGGLALGVGMLVDNSIVVLENITRYRDGGADRITAAVTGSQEVGGAILASTLTTLVVFLPLVFVRGMSGVMFRQLSLVVAFSLFCSFMSAISLVPMLASHILRRSVHHADAVGHWSDHFLHWSSRVLEAVEDRYRNLVAAALRHRFLVVVLCVAALGSSLLLLPLIGTELMPKSDESQVRVYIEMEVATRAENVDRAMQEVDRVVVAEVPEMISRISSCGSGGWRSTGSHKGELTINLLPVSRRTRSSEQIALDLGKKLAHIPGIKVRTREGQGLFLLRMASSSGENLAIDVRGHDFDSANFLSSQISRLAEEVPGVTDTQISRDLGTPEREIRIDRRKAADMKLTVERIADTLRTVLAGTQAGNFREGGDEHPIRVRVKGAEKMAIDDVLDLTVVNQDGEAVVMRNVVETMPTVGPVIIERKDQERTVSVAANIAERDMGSVVADIRAKLQNIAMPPGFAVTISGDYEDQQKAFRELLFSFALAVVLVYMVMACQFESLRDPFVIMFAVPFSVIGVILMLLLTDTTLNVQSAIGCIILAGIVVNNAILLVDQANLLRRRDGMPLHEAIAEAGRRRLRPILMTALTTTLALVPLALGMGEGGEAQAPMARAVVGGMFSSTVITLLLVPVIYSLMESWHQSRNNGKPVED